MKPRKVQVVLPKFGKITILLTPTGRRLLHVIGGSVADWEVPLWEEK